MTDSAGTGFPRLRETIERGGAPRYHQANAAKGKLFARDRIARLVDEGRSSRTGCSPTHWPTGCPPTA